LRSVSKTSFSNLYQLRRVLTADAFHTLVHNTVIGNQVIVRGDSPTLVSSALTVLQTLLPPQCINAIEYESTYQEAWKCNFLGLYANAEIPPDVDPTGNVLLDIKFDPFDEFVNSNNSAASSGVETVKFKHFYFQVYSWQTRNGKMSGSRSGVLTGGETLPLDSNSYTAQLDAILSQAPSKHLLNLQMSLLREEWINKTKIFFKLSRMQQMDTEEKLKKLVKVLTLKENDIPMLKFWTTGLGKLHRAKLLAS